MVKYHAAKFFDTIQQSFTDMDDQVQLCRAEIAASRHGQLELEKKQVLRSFSGPGLWTVMSNLSIYAGFNGWPTSRYRKVHLGRVGTGRIRHPQEYPQHC